MNADSGYQLRQILEGGLDDWHPPFSTLVWSLLMHILPGPAGYLVLINLLIWGGVGVLAAAAARRHGRLGLLVALVPLMPGAVNFLGHIHKDALLAGWLTAATGCAWLAEASTRSRKRSALAQIGGNLFLVAAFLTRINAVFALVPLLLYVNRRSGTKRSVAISMVLLLAMPLVMHLQNAWMGVEAKHPADSIKTYHLLALSYFEDHNLFPGEWTEDQSHRIVNACYSPVQWDNAAPWGRCSFIHDELERQGIWGSPELTRHWLTQLMRHPLAGYSALAATFRKSVRDPNSRHMLFDPPPIARSMGWAVDLKPPRFSTAWARAYVRSHLNDRLSRPWLFALMALLAVTLVLARAGLWATREGRLALALGCSSLAFIGSYFLTTVSAEFRYFYWAGIAAWLSLLMAAIAWRGRAGPVIASPPPMAIVGPIALLCGLSIGLIAAPFKLPTEKREVRLSVVEGPPVTITRLRTASIPPWMGIHFEGKVEAPDWHFKHRHLTGHPGSGPLTATITTLRQSIELEVVSGPGQGRVLVEFDGQRRIVDAGGAPAGQLAVQLDPPTGHIDERRHATFAAPLKAVIWAAVVCALILWLVRRSTRLRRPGSETCNAYSAVL